MISSPLVERGSSRSKTAIVAAVSMALLVVSLAVLLGGCGGEASLIGTWANPDLGSIQFMEDGTMVADIFEGMSPSYKIEGANMVISNASGVLVTLEYTLDGDTLTIKDPETGEPQVFARQ